MMLGGSKCVRRGVLGCELKGVQRRREKGLMCAHSKHRTLTKSASAQVHLRTMWRDSAECETRPYSMAGGIISTQHAGGLG
jgi:hypothetical protein